MLQSEKHRRTNYASFKPVEVVFEAVRTSCLVIKINKENRTPGTLAILSILTERLHYNRCCHYNTYIIPTIYCSFSIVIAVNRRLKMLHLKRVLIMQYERQTRTPCGFLKQFKEENMAKN